MLQHKLHHTIRLSLRSPHLDIGGHAGQEDYERGSARRKSIGAKILDATVMQCLPWV